MWSREIDELGMLSEQKKGAQCSRVIRLILIGLMIAILVGAIAILGIGIWTHEVEYGSKQLAGLIGFKLYQVDSVIMIVCGTGTIIIMVLGLAGLLLPQKCFLGVVSSVIMNVLGPIIIMALGLAGLLLSKKWLLGVHLSIISFLAFGLFAAGILGFVFVGELEDSVRGSLKKSITEKYGLPDEGSLTRAWDSVQQRFKCCGAYGGANDTNSWHLYHESYWKMDHYNINDSYVPKSCCKDQINNIDLCMGQDNSTDSWPPRHPPPILEQPTNYTLYTTGCYDQLVDYLEQNGLMIGTTAVVVGVFMIVEILMTIFVYRSLR